MFLSTWARQMRLLLWKNWILTWRSKKWLICELVVPLIIALPPILLVAYLSYLATPPGRMTQMSTPYFAPIWSIFGNLSDLSYTIARCQDSNSTLENSSLHLAWTVNEPSHEKAAESLMKKVTDRYGTFLLPMKFGSQKEMIETLSKDKERETSCLKYKFMGGVTIKKINEKRLDYAINMPTGKGSGDWLIDKSWTSLYPSTYAEHNRYSLYGSSGFTSLQFAIGSQFASNQTTNGLEPVGMLTVPDPPTVISIFSSIMLSILPYLWGICAFLSVIHSARELAQERSTVKSFLSVMGLSTPMFYLSHIVFGCIKCCVIFGPPAILLLIAIEYVSRFLLLLVILLYGCGAVLFGMLIATLFRKPNTALKMAILGWGGSFGLATVFPFDRDRGWQCRLHALNLNSAFQLTVQGMAEYTSMGVDVGVLTMFKGRNFSVGDGVLMLAFDLFWMASLVFLIDFLVENLSNVDVLSFVKRKILKRKMDNSDKVVELNADQKEVTDVPKDIEIKNLVKVYSSTGQLAVNNLSLDVYRGQVTVLLGHNGAGKSTTFSMISGLTKPTEGKFSLCGKEMGLSTRRDNMGLCPQHNALFNKLTVDDHLYLIHGLKGAKGNWKEEADGLLEALDLTSQRKTRSCNLSGGMKRKLCVCMAVIGGSQVVLLDEPTAGMDPGARRDVERLLLKIKGDRSVLLTTHYMDEAELLGDRIAIMAKGRVVCSGTAQYLKNKFGDGYQLTVALEDSQDPRRQADTIKGKAAAIALEVTVKSINGKQIQFQLPANQQDKFSPLFECLETSKQELGIASFGLSINTLEQVFLKVGELMEPVSENSKKGRQKLNRDLIESQLAPRHGGFLLVLHQILALWIKRFHYSRRNWSQLVTQFLLPMLCFGVLVLITANIEFEQDLLAGDRQFDVKSFGRARVIVDSGMAGKERYEALVKSDLVEIVHYDGGDLGEFLVKLKKYFPPPSYGLSWDNKTGTHLLIQNKRAVHAAPTSMNIYNNWRLDEGKSIAASLQLYNRQVSKSSQLYFDAAEPFVPYATVPAFALVTSAFVVFLIEERISKFAHQQSLSGVSPVVFWGASFAYDFFLYSLICSVFLGVFFVYFGWFTGFVHFIALSWFLYFLATMPFIYAMSFLFDVSSKANVLLVLLQVVAPLLAAMAVLSMGMLLAPLHLDPTLQANLKHFVNEFMSFLLPAYGLFLTKTELASIVRVEKWKEELEEGGKDQSNNVETSKQWSQIYMSWMCMGLGAFFVSLLFLLFQFKVIRFKIKQLFELCARKPQPTEETEDSDVARERTMTVSEGEVALNVVGLKKRFKKFYAVNDLTFHVQNKECFGLLGVNGAGKTTTFDILTGQNYPSSGTAHIGGVSVDKQLAIGYCPQFDALMEDLTGMETLILMARLYGFTDPKLKSELILNAVGMYEHRNKLTKHYSGGQKRKLSTGMALMAPARIVILDEPTAGIDPTARRDIWEVLSNVRDHSDSSILLTSHSMEECEALCSRVAILKKGRMVAIGTSQHLKTKFGNTYTMYMAASSPQHRSDIINRVAEIYPQSVLKSASSALTLRWQLPKTRDDKWSVVFASGLRMAKSLQVEDFCLAQSSLEEAFLQISNQDNQTNQGNQGPIMGMGGVTVPTTQTTTVTTKTGSKEKTTSSSKSNKAASVA